MSNFIVIYDSCVLYPAPLRDLLLSLAMTDLFRAKWTTDIHREWKTNLLKDRKDLTADKLERTQNKMNEHARDSLVENYQELIPSIVLPDSNDRHVVAAAIKSGAQTIVTYNLKDFPQDALDKYDIVAQHPDDFIRHLLDLKPHVVIKAVKEHRERLKNPPKSAIEYLSTLQKQSLPQTVNFLNDYISTI